MFRINITLLQVMFVQDRYMSQHWQLICTKQIWQQQHNSFLWKLLFILIHSYIYIFKQYQILFRVMFLIKLWICSLHPNYNKYNVTATIRGCEVGGEDKSKGGLYNLRNKRTVSNCTINNTNTSNTSIFTHYNNCNISIKSIVLII